tara:strand:+ start:967 stop:1533 length:567 start_codon:yes stop_codon:yes gene_type:complete
MAFNILSGSVIAPSELGPLKRQGDEDFILSGSLEGDGTGIINVPRIVANAEQYNLLTVGADANSLVGNDNLTFDGQTFSVYGDIHFIGSVVNNFISVTAPTYDVVPSDYYIAVDSTTNPIDITLPVAGNLPAGHTFIIKDQTGSSQINNIKIYARNLDLIDNQNYLILESPHSAIQIFCNGVDQFLII